MSEPPSFESIRVGTELPVLTKTPQRADLVKYAAGSGDFNPLHFDPEFPQAQELGNNIVHGRLKHAALGELVSTWLGHRGRVRSLRCEFRGTDQCGATFACHGRVAAKDEATRAVELELWVEDEAGRTTTPGGATIIFEMSGLRALG